ncbi:hypothetical protein [Parvibaculum sp.]|uniref:hypothetical protein n=1 Tax=Parvibaculum sp. TaxID=2024848 RepID=UPI0025E00F0F|nr:hypothetical protein [Parvibaculum sp.]
MRRPAGSSIQRDEPKAIADIGDRRDGRALHEEAQKRLAEPARRLRGAAIRS